MDQPSNGGEPRSSVNVHGCTASSAPSLRALSSALDASRIILRTTAAARSGAGDRRRNLRRERAAPRDHRVARGYRAYDPLLDGAPPSRACRQTHEEAARVELGR